MAATNRCPNCGAERPADALEGLCPRCLMQNALAEATPAPDAPATTPPPGASGAAADAATAPTLGPAGDTAAAPLTAAVAGHSTVDDGGPSGAADGLPRGATVRYFGDYEIRAELGRGGMGVVYEARQVSLNRPVALKMVKAGLLAGDDELRRFQNEAEAVALLDHSGILPVYEVGRHDGQHYFSMKLVPGGSLVPLLGRYKDDPKAAARLVAEAAEAVAHAHARGILHRDLKPANILVDDAGHPHITDFGLAKKVEADIELTQSGAILGTPAYMSPEQATGRRGGITTATDVHGLGALLYALLTAQAPFGGDSVVETIDAVRNSPPEPPRKLNATVPRDLETICLKCLEKDPRRRYPTAQALADDLRAWLESRPIAARRVGATERARLWCSRRPAVAALSAAVALATVGGTVTVIAVQAKANADLRAANRRVEQRYDLAVDAIRTFHTGVSEDFLLKQNQFKELRDRLLKSAADFYGKLGALLGHESDIASRRALLRAHFEVANLTGTVGRKQDALAAHLAVLAERESLAGEPGSDPEATADVARSLVAIASIQRQVGKLDESSSSYRRALALLGNPTGTPAAAARVLVADCHTGLGLLLTDRGGPTDAEARAEHLQALAIAQKLVDDNPGVADYLGRLAECHYNLALTAVRVQKRLEAVAEHRQAMALYQKLADDHPAVIDFRMKLADCHSGLAWALGSNSTAVATEAELREELRICRKLVDDYPGVTDTRVRLADCHNDLSNLMFRLGRLAEREAELREAVALYQGLVEEHPTVTDYRRGLAMCRYNLAGGLSRAGKPAEAEAEFRRVMALYQKLADDHPAVTEFRSWAVSIHVELGSMLHEKGKLAEAEDKYRQAVDHYRKLADDHPGATDFRGGLAGTHVTLARLLVQAGKPTEAEAAYRQAMVLYQKLVDDHPTVTGFRDRLARSHTDLGVFLSQAGKPTEAEAAYRRAMALYQKLADDHPGERLFGIYLASNHLNLGWVLWQHARRPAEAEVEYRRALAIAKRLADQHPGSVQSRSELADNHDALGWFLSQTGNLAEAEADYRQALAIRQKVADDDAVPGRFRSLAEGHLNLGALLWSANKPAEAKAEFSRALAIRQKLVVDHPGSVPDQVGLAHAWARVGRSRQAGEHGAEAALAFREAVTIIEQLPQKTSDNLYDLACYLALLSKALDRPDTGSPAPAGRDSADRAICRLRDAVDAGSRNLAHMRTDTDLDPLRSRPDFQLLMMDLAMPADPFARAR
jgi:tetratricopeptide (TPR) repeat protein